MKVKRKVTTTIKVELELTGWEADDLEKILDRLSRKSTIHRSEFTMREKVTGRKLVQALKHAK